MHTNTCKKRIEGLGKQNTEIMKYSEKRINKYIFVCWYEKGISFILKFILIIGIVESIIVWNYF